MPEPSRPVHILAFPNVQLLDVTGPLQVFASANVQLQENGQAAHYCPRVVAAQDGSVVSSSGLGLLTDPLPETASDTLIVAGKGHEEGQTIGEETHPFSDHAEVRAALKGAAA